MNKSTLLLSAVLLGGGLIGSGILLADDDRHEGREHEYEEHEEQEEHERNESRRGPGNFGVGAVSDAQYAKECGSCHFAYQPGLLPARSWTALMGGLSDHFGENAELDADTQQALTDYLTTNAGDAVPSAVARELLGRLPADAAPLRISELPGFRQEHDEISLSQVQKDPEVQSFSHCGRCHTDAAEGTYAEHKVIARYHD